MATARMGGIPQNLKTAKWKNVAASVQKRFIKLSTDGVDYATADTDRIIGVTYNDGIATGNQVSYWPFVPGDEIQVLSSGVITAGDAVTAAAGGKAASLALAVTKFMAGEAINTVALNDYVTIRCAPGYTSG